MNTAIEIEGTFEAPGTSLAERRDMPRCPLMLAAWLWRAKSPDTPIAIRLLDHAVQTVGFISPVGLEENEPFEIALERAGPRHQGLHVARCESLTEDTFRIGGCM